MATIRIPLLGNALSTTAGAYWAPYSAYNSGTTRDVGVWVFQDAQTGTVSVGFQVPKNWISGSTNIILLWTSSTTAGNVVWNVTHRSAAAASTLMDTNTTPASRTDTLTTSSKPGAGDQLESDTVNITDTDWAVDEFVAMDIIRLGSDGSDTKADSAILFGAMLEYADA